MERARAAGEIAGKVGRGYARREAAGTWWNASGNSIPRWSELAMLGYLGRATLRTPKPCGEHLLTTILVRGVDA